MLITAIIKPFKLEEVRDALAEIGIEKITASEVKGFGRQKGHTEIYRGSEYAVDFLPKIQIQIAIEDHQVDQVQQAVAKGAYTGKIGDGVVFVTQLEYFKNIRTEESSYSTSVEEYLRSHYQEAVTRLRARDADYRLARLTFKELADELSLNIQKAKAGSPLAALLCGLCFHLGIGHADKVQAYSFYNIASLHGIHDARVLRDMIKSRMTAMEVSTAQEESRQFALAFLPQLHWALPLGPEDWSI